MYRPQAIILLPSHVSSENFWSLHESTMNDAILDSAIYFARARACYENLDYSRDYSRFVTANVA